MCQTLNPLITGPPKDSPAKSFQRENPAENPSDVFKRHKRNFRRENSPGEKGFLGHRRR